MKFTILGSTGFIGRHLVRHLRDQGFDVATPPRDASDLHGRSLGHVIYAIGVVGSPTQRPHTMIEAHVNQLQRLLKGADFDSWLYLSSTRVYGGLATESIAFEETELPVFKRPGVIFELSKLMGEQVCLELNRDTVRIARLSNVYGADQSPDTFLGSIMTQLVAQGEVAFLDSPESSKDYISVKDAVKMLQYIAVQGRETIYNVASGKNVSHQDIADRLRACGYAVKFPYNSQVRIFPKIDTARVSGEFASASHSVLDDMPQLIDAARKIYTRRSPKDLYAS